MASKRRIRRIACAGKHRHPDQTGAVKHLVSLEHSGRKHGDVRSYHCRFCNGWHVGHY